MNLRIGLGYDVHKLVENRKLILGGININYNLGLLGHSDADVLVHAIIDSILGAMCKGDIGTHFPDTDENYKNADSINLLKKIVVMLENENYKIVNIDTIIIAQKPKLLPYINLMQENISKTLKINKDCINIKATTEEGLGFTGNLEGISAKSICLLQKI